MKNGYDIDFPAYLVEKDIKEKKAQYEKFIKQVETYNDARTLWNDSVDALKAHYKKVDDKPEPGFFDFLSTEEILEEPKLTAKPKVPVVPAPYTGIVLGDFLFNEGYGELTSSFLKTHNDDGTILHPFNMKYFGLFGQGTEPGMGYDINIDTDDESGIPKCSNRYFSINLMP